LAPTHIDVPTGRSVTIDYSGESPVLAVKLQEMFGARSTPTVADGRVPILVHLLSPAGRPVQVTRDLEGFWRSGYAAVRAELRGRYPKHPWPDDPLTAPPTKGVKRRGA
jgi:ATP-dependent helicase HrpB